MKKINILFFLLMAGVMTCLTSCLNSGNDEDGNDGYLTAYVTITGTYPQYVLYVDGGGEVTLSYESLNQMTDGKGFGSNKRALIHIGYKNENVTYKDNDKSYPIIKEGTLMDGQFVTTTNAMNNLTAVGMHLCEADSIFPIEKYNDAWYYGGYLNLNVYGQYSVNKTGNVLPTMNLVYNQDEIDTDKIKFQLLYNRHSSKDAVSGGYYNFITSFNVADVMRQVPGTGEVEIEISAEKDLVKTFKVKR